MQNLKLLVERVFDGFALISEKMRSTGFELVLKDKLCKLRKSQSKLNNKLCNPAKNNISHKTNCLIANFNQTCLGDTHNYFVKFLYHKHWFKLAERAEIFSVLEMRVVKKSKIKTNCSSGKRRNKTLTSNPATVDIVSMLVEMLFKKTPQQISFPSKVSLFINNSFKVVR